MTWDRSMGIVAAVIVVVFGCYRVTRWVDQETCLSLLPVQESAKLQTREAKELMPALNATYANGITVGPTPEQKVLGLSRPLRVISVSGKTATVLLAGSSSEANFEYPEAWQSVWAHNHGIPIVGPPGPCVIMHETWNGGGFTTKDRPATTL
jgi:hypothetical protein